MNQNLIDRAEFVAFAGNGGDGAIAFRSGYGVAKGGPAGGNGGSGGSVVLRASRHVATLRWFAGKDAFEAHSGEKGAKKNQTGKNAPDLVLEVPLGTVVMVDPSSAQLLKGRMIYGKDVDWGVWSGKRVDTVPYSTFEDRWELEESTKYEARNSRQNSKDKAQIPNQFQNSNFKIQNDNAKIKALTSFVQVVDLDEDGMEVVLAKGGRGGKGNTEFKSSTYTTPRVAQRGEKGEEFRVRLELKVLADVGLVGEPNVGKSTILSVITRARPEIANYPFTTLSPNLGVLEEGTRNKEQGTRRSMVLADIPGLIEDAHEGKGLGTDFLRHIERCKALVFVVSPMEDRWAGSGEQWAETLWGQYQGVRRELEEYGQDLLKKPSMVVVNKRELVDIEQWAVISNYFKDKGSEVLLLSAARHEGTDELKKKIWELVDRN